MNRELDDLVAEKVMGWDYIPPFAATMAPASWSLGDNEFIETEKWHPSTSISDAWLVIEDMRKRGYEMTLEYFVDGSPLCQVAFTGLPTDESGSNGSDTAPEAICLAALEVFK